MSDWAQRLLDEADREPWQATITRTRCPFMWNVDFSKGLMGFREWPLWPTIGTRKRAEAVTRRRIRRLERSDQRRANQTTITGDTA